MLTKYCFEDTETTGTNCVKNGVIQFAGHIIFENDGKYEIKDTFNFTPNLFPTDVVDEEALKVNGITMEEILGRELPHHSYSSFIKMLSKYVNKYDRQDKMFFIGYNARFDFDFMRAWFEKCGDKYFGSWFYFPPIDVMNQAIIQLIHERHLLPNFKLQTVADYLKIEADGKYHDALKDIDITEKLFFKFIGKGEIQL